MLGCSPWIFAPSGVSTRMLGSTKEIRLAAAATPMGLSSDESDQAGEASGVPFVDEGGLEASLKEMEGVSEGLRALQSCASPCCRIVATSPARLSKEKHAE